MRRLLCSCIALLLLLLPCRGAEATGFLPAVSDGVLSDGNMTAPDMQIQSEAAGSDAALPDGNTETENAPAQAEAGGGIIILPSRNAGAGMFQAGSYSGEQSAAQRQTSFSLRMRSIDPEAALYTVIVSAMQGNIAPETYDLGSAGNVYALRVDIGSCGYSYSPDDPNGYNSLDDAIYRVYTRAVNDNPDLFYFVPMVHYGIVEQADGTNLFQSLYMQVNQSAYGKKEAYEKAKQAMLAEAFPDGSDGMTLTETALALHDYIALQVRYDHGAANAAGATGNTAVYNSHPSAFSAYGAIVEKEAVCHGLSLAYKTLLQDLGMTAYVVPDPYKGHAWNLVKLENDCYYHADLTDAIGVYNPSLNQASHARFLLSDAEQAVSYPKANWEWANLPAATNRHPDAAFFRDINSAMHYMEGQWYYNNGSGGAGALQKSAYGSARKAQTILAGASYPVRIGEKLYFFSPTDYEIYAYSPAKGVATAREAIFAGGYKSFRAEGSELFFTLTNNASRRRYEGADLGDVNADDWVNVEDVLAVFEELSVANGTLTAEELPKAEVIYDDLINGEDIRRIAEMAVGLAV